MEEQGEISKVHSFLRKSRLLKPIRLCYAQILNIYRYGMKYECFNIMYRLIGRYEDKKFYKKIVISEQERQEQKKKSYEKKLCVIILFPLFNTPEKYLLDMIESEHKHTY